MDRLTSFGRRLEACELVAYWSPLLTPTLLIVVEDLGDAKLAIVKLSCSKAASDLI